MAFSIAVVLTRIRWDKYNLNMLAVILTGILLDASATENALAEERY